MVRIKNFIRREKLNAVPTDMYVIDKHSTMGRLVKKMLDKGHVGHRHFDSLVYIDNLESEEQELDKTIMAQVRGLQREGRKPIKVLIGGRTYRDFISYTYETHGFWECRQGVITRDLTQPDGYHRSIEVLGLPATIVPTMDGVLVLDSIMMEVF